MKQYEITGMSCAACSARVEKAVSALEGVTSCSVNLLTNSMLVSGTAPEESIIKAVEDAGYGIVKKGENQKKESAKDKEISTLKNRFLTSLGFLLLLMYIAMGHTMWGFPLPGFLSENPLAIGLIQLLLSTVILIINQKFFISGFKALFKKAPNMDTLVALGSGASYGYSLYALFSMTSAYTTGNIPGAYHYYHEFYFESAAMIVTLITLGKMLEARSKGKTTNALKSLMDLKPKTAQIVKDGKIVTVSADSLIPGDIFIVKPGESIPADGIITEGFCAVDESALTGESLPVDKKEGDTVSAGTLNRSGFITCRATKSGEDTTLGQIIQMVENATMEKAPIAKVADKVSGFFVPCVMAIALLTAIIWLVLGEPVGTALGRGIAVLVISCPCALGLATPVAIMVGSGMGAKNGILFKTATSLEETGKIKIVALDKTGTITEGRPQVTDILPEGSSKDSLLSLAYALEIKSEHPLGRAIITRAEKEGLTPEETTDFSVTFGGGISAQIQGEPAYGGNMALIEKYCSIPPRAKEQAEILAKEGKTPLFFGKNGVFCGIIAVADTVKEDSKEAILTLQKMGIEVVMVTGDNPHTAQAIKEQVGIDSMFAGVLPAQKEAVIKDLKKRGKTAMVGDGINDAPALTAAHIGIAIGAGTDVAIDAADVVLMQNSLTKVAGAISLSRQVLKNIHQNLFWAFFYNTVGIPLAAGVLIPFLGIGLSPMFGAAAMSLSSFCVVSNALRLNFFTIQSTQEKEKKNMETTLQVKGMMCPHCEARVKTIVEGIPGVKEATPNHKEGTVKVVLEKEIDMEIVKSAITKEGYQVL